MPISLAIFYPEVAKIRILISFFTLFIAIPSIAIACESAIYIFKNFKPFFRFDLPSLDMPTQETEIF